MKITNVHTLDLTDFYNQTFLMIDAYNRQSHYKKLKTKGKVIYDKMFSNKSTKRIKLESNKFYGNIKDESFKYLQNLLGNEVFDEYIQIKVSSTLNIIVPRFIRKNKTNSTYVSIVIGEQISYFEFKYVDSLNDDLNSLVYYLFTKAIELKKSDGSNISNMISRASVSNSSFSTLLELWSLQAQSNYEDDNNNKLDENDETIKIDFKTNQMINDLDNLLINAFKKGDETPKTSNIRKSFTSLELAQFYIEFHEGVFTNETDDFREYITFEHKPNKNIDSEKINSENKLKMQVYDVVLNSIQHFKKVELNEIEDKNRMDQLKTVLNNSGSLKNKIPSIYEVKFKNESPKTEHVKTFVHGTPLKSVASILSTGLKNSNELSEMKSKQKQGVNEKQILLDYNFTGTAYGTGVYFSNLSNASQSLGYTGQRTQILLMVDYFYNDKEDFTSRGSLNSEVIVGTKSKNAIIKYVIAWDKN